MLYGVSSPHFVSERMPRITPHEAPNAHLSQRPDEPHAWSQSNNEPVKPPSFRRAILFGTFLVLLDALWLNQGAIAFLVAIWLFVVSLPRALIARKYVTVRAQCLRNIAVYFGAVIIVFVLNTANISIAQSRAETLVSAVKAFHSKNQRYPRSLDELVPEQIDHVPLAKYTLAFNQFNYYRLTEQDASLSYTAVPPFGRPTYFFRLNKWVDLD
jgi:hypothetical protein